MPKNAANLYVHYSEPATQSRCTRLKDTIPIILLIFLLTFLLILLFLVMSQCHHPSHHRTFSRITPASLSWRPATS
eukprot:810020-Pyramimonas_sp.AAC.1